MPRSFEHYFTKLDINFFETVSLKFDKGKVGYKTKVGAIGSILFNAIFLTYSLNKLTTMFTRGSNKLSEFIEFDHFDSQ